ncbi:MAG: class I SAM-dependent methyltransferase [Betaproteobacteria bacterium]|nr:class I SAM-dependent methyltransferase [Betaproteobacteria bacterium]
MQTPSRQLVSSPIRDRLCGALLAAAAAMPVAAAEPRVPYVPTPQAVVDRILEIGRVGSNDYLIDLGSGDGRIVITAAKNFGTRGFGVDIDPELIEESNENARRTSVADRVAFYQRDLFDTSLAEATVITMYLAPHVNLELRPRLLALKPGTRIVSHDFSMDAWQPDQHVVVEALNKFGRAGGRSDVYLWIVPARVAGRWTWESAVGGRAHSYEIVLQQRYQVLSGTARIGGRLVKLDQARVRGDELRVEFTIDINGARVKHALTGKVDGDDVFGTAMLSGERLQSQGDWTARRVTRTAVATDETRRRQFLPHPPVLPH